MWYSPVSEGLETYDHDERRRVYATEQEKLEFVVVHQYCDAREGGPLRNGGVCAGSEERGYAKTAGVSHAKAAAYPLV